MTPVPPMLEAYATERRRKFRVTCSQVDEEEDIYNDEDAFDSISMSQKNDEVTSELFDLCCSFSLLRVADLERCKLKRISFYKLFTLEHVQPPPILGHDWSN